MAEPEKEKSKIIVDDDWKNQAQADKEKLAEQVDAPGGKEAREIPPATFSTLIGSMLSQVFMSLGGYQDPQTGRRYLDLELAKHYIDTMAMLEEKTKGNLTPEEKGLLDRSIYEARMQYVQIAQRATRA